MASFSKSPRLNLLSIRFDWRQSPINVWCRMPFPPQQKLIRPHNKTIHTLSIILLIFILTVSSFPFLPWGIPWDFHSIFSFAGHWHIGASSFNLPLISPIYQNALFACMRLLLLSLIFSSVNSSWYFPSWFEGLGTLWGIGHQNNSRSQNSILFKNLSSSSKSLENEGINSAL